MKEIPLIIDKEKIYFDNGEIVMHEWEYPLMKAKADFVCQNRGDILEFGFGMGISATYIQYYNVNSHTICEIHPQILEKLYEWAKDKPNIIILEGDWIDNVKNFTKYDGILFDTHRELNIKFLRQNILNWAKNRCNITWFNSFSLEHNLLRLPNVTYNIIDVNPPKNTYFNKTKYYMPQYTHKI
jgi:hypothetical protein